MLEDGIPMEKAGQLVALLAILLYLCAGFGIPQPWRKQLRWAAVLVLVLGGAALIYFDLRA